MKFINAALTASITWFVFWVGSVLFSNHVLFQDATTLFLSAVLFHLLGYMIYIPIKNYMEKTNNTRPTIMKTLLLILVFLVVFLSIPLRMWILDHFLDGVDFKGFWIYLLFMVILLAINVRFKKISAEKI